MRSRSRLTNYLCLCCLLGAVSALTAGPSPRLIVVKVDGLSGLFLEASLDPAGPAVPKLPYPEQFQEAHRYLASVYRREVLLPNLHRYFSVKGVSVPRMHATTIALSAPTWAVIDSGQPSIIKNHYRFDRSTGELRDHLDALRNTTSQMLRDTGRTSALWELDLLRIPIVLDAFPADRNWSSIQILYRKRPIEQLSNLGKFLVSGGVRGGHPDKIVRQHLRHQVYRPDYPEWNDQALARMGAGLIRDSDDGGSRQLDFLSLFFPTLDHQFHVDPDYRNLLNWMVKVDSWFGEIMAAVEQSPRKDDTLVALISDHGLDYDPVHVNYSLPVNRWLREKDFGTHTVLSPHTEDGIHALTVPVRGVDQARIYESPDSPYGPDVPFGEKGYYTAFTANAGNPRFDAFLRNSDLNRMHLLLLEVKRHAADHEVLQQIFTVFREVHSQVMPWLAGEVEGNRKAVSALTAYRASFPDDAAGRDVAARLEGEAQRRARLIPVLQRLLEIPMEWDGWLGWARSGFSVSDWIPKGYLGPPNNLDQLRNYVAGWENPAERRWRDEPTAFRQISYPDLIASFTATNPDAYGNRYPFYFFSSALPVEKLSWESDRPLKQAIWISLSERRGEAVILEAEDGSLRYLPIQSLQMSDGIYRIEPDNAGDPLGYRETLGETTWLSPHQWASATGDTYPSLLPVIISDLFRPNYRDFIRSEHFRDGLSLDSSTDVEDVIAALDLRYSQAVPDFRVWMRRGWNVNSKSPTPGGTHGGFHPLETTSVFALWGGRNLGLPRGKIIRESHLTLDIAPTLLQLMGRLGGEGEVRSSDSIRFYPLPGRLIRLDVKPEQVQSY